MPSSVTMLVGDLQIPLHQICAAVVGVAWLARHVLFPLLGVVVRYPPTLLASEEVAFAHRLLSFVLLCPWPADPVG